MQPEHLKIGGGLAESSVHPLVVILMLVAALLILLLARKNVIVPVLLMAFLVPLGQQFVIAGVHVLVLRIIILVALIRALVSQGRCFSGGVRTLDKVFFLWTFFHVITFLFLFSFASAAFVNQFGFMWDALGGFLVMRFYVQEDEDIYRVLRTFAFISGALALCMLNEHFRMQNIYGFLGSAQTMPEVRDGSVRAQGPFAHPLLAGTFGATLLPLFFLYWRGGKSKALAMVGIISSTIMTICASSSTPFLAYGAGIGAVCFWPLRKNMRMIRWGSVGLLLALQLVMKAPVWFLIAHISLFGSSSSYHRAYLVDTFIRHFSDWWLVGTNDAGNWGWDMWDTSNQYIAEGEGGGLVSFVLFIAMISISFGRIGKARKAVEGDRDKEWVFWFLGSALFANVVGFFGVSYFDQTRVAWYGLLVMIATATASVLATNAKTELQPADTPMATPEAIPSHPWLSAPARKAMLGQPGSEFKTRRS